MSSGLPVQAGPVVFGDTKPVTYIQATHMRSKNNYFGEQPWSLLAFLPMSSLWLACILLLGS